MANFSAPSPMMLLKPTLYKTGVKFKRQRVLTAGIEGWGGVLKGGEGLVLPEALGQVLGGFSVEAIHCQAANESRIEASGAADACLMGQVCGKAGAYSSEVRPSFILRVSASWVMPDMSLP